MRVLTLAIALSLSSFASAATGPSDAAFKTQMAKVLDWRRDIHAHPELGNNETRTSALVAEHLRKLGLQVRTGIAKTGVVAILKGGHPGKLLALRADMDALPVTEQVDLPFASKVTVQYRGQTTGVMHACGHDSHVANLLGVADLLTAMKDQLHGDVMFIFQPAEEGAPDGEEGGAALMLKEGLFSPRKPDAVMGLHVTSNLNVGEIGYRVGPMMAAVDSFYITVKGKQVHGSRPWQGIDPIIAAAQIITGVNTIVSRQVDISDSPAVISFGAIHGGIRENIIPDQVEMMGTIRNFNPETRLDIFARIKNEATHIAMASGATAEVRIKEQYPVTANEQALTEQMLPTLQRVAGSDKVKKIALITGAEDFSFLAQAVPGLYIMVGVTAPNISPREAPTNHSPLFKIDEDGLPLALRALTHMAVDYLNAP
jgi:amidohydrolase